MATPPFFVDSFLAYTIGIVVFFAGWGLNQKVGILQKYNIPEPVTGGILAALAALMLKVVFDFEVEYDLATRDFCWSTFSRASD